MPAFKRKREDDSDIGAYRDQHFKGTKEDQENKLKDSKTLYVGNLSFHTTEEQIIEFFSMAGNVQRVVMGLDRFKKTPCGFCFVENAERKDAELAMKFINGTRLDERSIRTDWDAGFEEGRQFGRGRAGGQVREEYRTNYDPERGGYGQIVKRNRYQTKRRRYD